MTYHKHYDSILDDDDEAKPCRWASIDAADKSGVAVWVGERLSHTLLLRRKGKKGKYCIVRDGKEQVFPSEWAAWSEVLRELDEVALEAVHGRFHTALVSLAKRHGRIEAWCAVLGVKFGHTVKPSDWRKVAGDRHGISWPGGAEAKKERVRNLLWDVYKIKDTTKDADIADATFVGEWRIHAIGGLHDALSRRIAEDLGELPAAGGAL